MVEAPGAQSPRGVGAGFRDGGIQAEAPENCGRVLFPPKGRTAFTICSMLIESGHCLCHATLYLISLYLFVFKNKHERSIASVPTRVARKSFGRVPCDLGIFVSVLGLPSLGEIFRLIKLIPT